MLFFFSKHLNSIIPESADRGKLVDLWRNLCREYLWPPVVKKVYDVLSNTPHSETCTKLIHYT